MRIERRKPARQIADYYIKLIEIGRIKHGDPLPGRGEIADVHGVGRMVAQQALLLMVADGYAVTVPRKASYAVVPGAATPSAC